MPNPIVPVVPPERKEKKSSIWDLVTGSVGQHVMDIVKGVVGGPVQGPPAPLPVQEPPIIPTDSNKVTPVNSSSSVGGTNYGSSSINTPSAYDELKKTIAQSRLDNGKLVDEQIGAIKGFYGDSSKDFYDRYVGSRGSLDERAANLGVSLDKSTIGTNWDAALRRLQELSDSNRDSDLSYMEKMRGVKDLSYEALLAGIEQDKINAVRAAMSGGGRSYGGSGRSGGSSGSGNATQTSTVNNVGDYELYNQLSSVNPMAAQLFYNSYFSNEGDAAAAVKDLMQTTPAVNNIAKTISSFINFGKPPTKPVAPWINNSSTLAQNALKALTGLWGNPKIVQKVTEKS